MRDIGTAGESFFNGWCASAGITANKSVSDAHGWDVFIEIDAPENTLDPFTMHKGMIESKIQIKSTDGNKKFVDVELSNLKKMSTTLLPAFYILIEFDKNDMPVRAFIKHVDNSFIYKVLSRIRKVTVENPTVKLNKKTMRVHFEEEIYPLGASALKKLIHNHINGSQSLYVDQKRQYLDSAGFEDGAYRVKFQISDMQQLERLIDASLGKKIGVEIEEMHGAALRFGFSSPMPELTVSNAVLEILNVKPNATGKMTFRDKSTGQSTAFAASLYQGMALFTDRKKIRIDADVFEIMMRSDLTSMTMSGTLNHTKAYEVEDLLKAYTTFQMLWQPTDIEWGLDFFGIKTKILLNSPNGFDDCSDQVKLLKKIIEIKRYFNWLDSLCATIVEINKKTRNINEICCLINGSTSEVSMRYPSGSGPDVNSEVNCFYVVHLELGGYYFIEVILVSGKVEIHNDQEDKVRSNQWKSIYKTVVEVSNTDGLKAELDSVVDDYSNILPKIDFTSKFLHHIGIS
ncbi:hypothetical protein HBR94_09410 [Pseudomonas sp. WS 5412]|uniref:hypothetical protein n=1 Tax=Pseudomonas sp. WS 5412 TaxID=2717487 RepID=UPI001472DA4C|nr:hypothetical protein [Pseudomonas sp. WS 5412]NMY31714.1 hypothetical protein [Pseudomonas sp. WS 5412]